LWLSAASIWEILSKAGPYLVKKLAQNHIELLPMTLDHILKIEQLPMHHRDPFDRVLIAQCLEEGWPIITSDAVFRKYPIRVIW
jgi:PIN domain nuclease of toxin-antitoxin system